MLVSFELRKNNNSDVLDVVVDEDGLNDLMAQLSLLREKRTDHIHMFAESWGGYPLAEAPVNDGAKPIRHVQITLR